MVSSRGTAALAVCWRVPSQGWFFIVVATDFNDRNDIVVRYADRNVERSGWLNGEKYIAGKTAMASVGYEQGKVVLIGFRTQNRAQTHGTHKFLFNALVTPPAKAAMAATHHDQ